MNGEKLTNKAVVIANEGNMAKICLINESECGHCTNLFCGINKKKDEMLTVKNNISAIPGDKVIISVKGKMLVSATMILYVMPLILVVASIFLSMQLMENTNLKEAYSTLIATSALGIYFLCVYYIKNTNLLKEAIPEIIKIDK